MDHTYQSGTVMQEPETGLPSVPDPVPGCGFNSALRFGWAKHILPFYSQPSILLQPCNIQIVSTFQDLGSDGSLNSFATSQGTHTYRVTWFVLVVRYSNHMTPHNQLLPLLLVFYSARPFFAQAH